MKRLVYVIGPPGSGKSTLMAGLTRGLLRVARTDHGLPRDELYHRERLVGVELGRQRGDFSGTDALAMNIHPRACAWLRHGGAGDAPVVYAEGQRLATLQFIKAGLEAGREVDLLYLDPPPEVAEARRRARGSRQSEAWIKGATTRAARLAREASELPGVRVLRIVDHGSAHGRTTAMLRRELHLDPFPQEVT